MLKIDLHTHSVASPDGGIRPEQYAQALEQGVLDYIAVTDHNRVDAALELRKTLGDRIIVGEEITTTQGELIGLFLSKAVPAGQTPLATAQAIHQQKGLVCVPHPFETVRQGISPEALDKMMAEVDVVEAHNGRAVFQNRGPQAIVWARLHSKALASNSDAHGLKGLGSTYTLVKEAPTAKNLIEILRQARFRTQRPPLRTLLYPKANRLTKKLGLQR